MLPVTATQERAGTRTNWEGRAQRFSRAVDGPSTSQDDWEVFVQVAAVLGRDLGANGTEAGGAERDRIGRRATRHALPAVDATPADPAADGALRSEEHTAELQSPTSRPYAVFCL